MESLVDQLKSAYAGKRVLVTGHNGFKGSWLVAFLEFLGAKVYGISLKIEDQSPFKEFHEQGPHESYITDIRNFDLLKSKVEQIDPQLVFHLAAQSLVLDSYERPRETFEVNVQGSVNLLQSLLGTNCQGVIVTTTDKVYKNDDTGIIFKESDELWGHDPYSLSKTGTELAVAAWRNLPRNKQCQFITARAGNVFGAGDIAKNRLLPDLLRSISLKSNAEIRNPDSVRPWQYVLDPLLGYLMLGYKVLNEQQVGKTYNFGPSENSIVSVLEFVLQLQAISRFEFSSTHLELGLESTLLRLDSTRADTELGWRATTSLVSGLRYSILLNQPQLSFEECRNHIEEYLLSAQNSLMK